MKTQTRSTANWLVRGLAASVLCVALAMLSGCAARPAPLGGTAPTTLPPDLVFVIPPGAESADQRGAPIFQIPSDLTVLTGQSVVIQNNDHAMHYFAEAPIAPGQTYRKLFGRAGAFGYGGVLSCSIAEKKTVTVTVLDRLAPGAAPSTTEPR